MASQIRAAATIKQLSFLRQYFLYPRRGRKFMRTTEARKAVDFSDKRVSPFEGCRVNDIYTRCRYTGVDDNGDQVVRRHVGRVENFRNFVLQR